MIRSAVTLLVLGVLLWTPWMDTSPGRATIDRALEAFGPVPSSCYDSDGNELQNGVAQRWYPLGRLVHTCSGDYVVWFWGAVKEMGGVTKKADEIHRTQSKPLSCTDILERQETRLGTSTDASVSFFEGPYATDPDYSLLPKAEEQNRNITEALKSGPNFAGSFTVTSWECGANCEQHAIINTKDGQVVAYGLPTEYGVAFSIDSTLLVTNPLGSLPELPDNDYEAENVALSIARVPREYYRLTSDALSGTQYLVKLCVENAATGYIAVEDDRIGLVTEEY